MDLHPGMPRELADRVGELEQPRPVRVEGAVPHAAGRMDEQGELELFAVQGRSLERQRPVGWSQLDGSLRVRRNRNLHDSRAQGGAPERLEVRRLAFCRGLAQGAGAQGVQPLPASAQKVVESAGAQLFTGAAGQRQKYVPYLLGVEVRYRLHDGLAESDEAGPGASVSPGL